MSTVYVGAGQAGVVLGAVAVCALCAFVVPPIRDIVVGFYDFITSLLVASALINQPLVVLADEPTGNLDSAATAEMLRLFADVHDAGQTLLLVTHDPRVAATADRLLSMRDGSIVEDVRLEGGLSRQALLAQVAGWEA